MSISFTPTVLLSIANSMYVLSRPGTVSDEIVNSAHLVQRALWRFEREFEGYIAAPVKTGKLSEVRKYHRLLVGAADSFQISTLKGRPL